ncbi:hypothetical protein ACET3X_001890 [Alternaria dauci]|uniref:F-box domain-containing protein n=1 Tax=Alternaria dauci TaxID=48095 RepID=A0ABR3UYN3_9PLEO
MYVAMSEMPASAQRGASDHACGQLRKRALRALSEESIRKARVAALQQELALLEQDLASTAPTTQDAVEELAKTECQQLANAVLTKLPREIRDMIYLHLSTRDRELIEREHFRTTLDPLTRLYSYNFERWKA